MKKCTKCNIEKPFNYFYKSKASKDFYNWNCKECCKIRFYEWKDKSDKSIKYLERKNNYSKNYKSKNKDILKTKSFIYREINKEKRSNVFKIWYELNKVNLNKKRVEYRKSCPIRNLSFLLRLRISKALKRKDVNLKNDLINILGVDIVGCRNHIESKFDERMSWNNHGPKTWHIDHIVPLSSAKNEEELLKLCHYTNLQPLWWSDNLKKGSKINLN